MGIHAGNVVDDLIRLLNLFLNCGRSHQPVGFVHIVVRSDQVAFLVNPFNQFGIFLRIRADEKKCRLRPMALEQIKQLRSIFRIGAIVEGERELLIAGPVLKYAKTEDPSDQSGYKSVQRRDIK
ncbi:hypothetical protein D3C81_1505900 [compost metagenome]